jgi:glycosyltransferase involved in cell wall biosynthesis
MSAPLRVLIATDAFPPVCGGSGWSTFELARGLVARGHHVEIVRAEATASGDAGVAETTYADLRVTTVRGRVPDIPVLRNVLKNERAWGALSTYLLEERLMKAPYDILHAQHVMTTVPSIRAGKRAGTPVVATVRDYWPVCYWSDLIYDPAAPDLCPACTTGNMTKCVLPRAGAASIGAWPVIPYMKGNLRTKRRTLADADAVIAVSSVIARDLETRAPELASTPMFTIPNPVDMAALDAVHDEARPLVDARYVLYAGKLATNKGVQYLIPAYRQAGLLMPLVVVGDGPLKDRLEREAREAGVDLRLMGWRDRAEVWALMRHASFLAYPSYGPESLSRVLIEAAALGVPIAAMDRGGTRDILKHGETGLLSQDPAGFAADLARLSTDERLRAAIGAAARHDVRARFSATSVVERVERVYRGLLTPRAA